MSHVQEPIADRRSSRRYGPTRLGSAVVAVCLVIAFGLPAASAEVPQTSPQVGVKKSPISRQKPGKGIDFANAIPTALPQADVHLTPLPETILKSQQAVTVAQPRVHPGSVGSGQLMPVTLVPKEVLEERIANRETAPIVIAPQQFGTWGLPYTTSQVNAFGDDTDLHYPFRAAGKVFYNNQLGQTFVCSASLIGRGIVVTAAHCVAEFGSRLFYSNWQFLPAYSNGQAPFGVSTARQAFVMPSWFDGTDPCAGGPGVACPNDVAIVTLNPLAGGNYVGSFAGWLGVGADGFGFTPSSTTQVTQLGYPSALDGGAVMERNDSLGYVDPNLGYNTVIGSLMTGGSSGGPWVVNLGMPPSLSGTSFGQASAYNVVVGVTSWGVVAPDDVKAQGASPFTGGNVFALLAAACTATPAACQ
jgi:hypothetical protein